MSLLMGLPSAPKSSLSGPAPGFDCKVLEHAQDIPLNPLAMYMNALNAVYLLSAFDMRRVWAHQVYTLRAYDVEVVIDSGGDTEGETANLQNRFVIWSIQHIMYHVWVNRKWKPVVGLPRWQDRSVGIVRIWKRGLQPGINDINPGNDTEAVLLSSEDGLSGAVPSLTAGGGDIQYLYQYEGTTVNSNYVFLAALEGIGEAAEAGLDSRCEEFLMPGYSTLAFTFTSNKDEHGNPLLRYGYVRIALKRMVSQMVKDRKFHEMTMVILQDGQEIAKGGCKQWAPPPTLSATAEQ